MPTHAEQYMHFENTNVQEEHIGIHGERPEQGTATHQNSTEKLWLSKLRF